ncbi:MAG: GNAT family N-acetyltransferase [Thermodesulfobacteriota bacterium]
MELSIREAAERDYESLCEIFEEVDSLHREALPHVFCKSDGPARSKDFIFGIIADNLAVKQNFRRSGVGRSLIKRAHQWAVDKGLAQVELNVWEFNEGAIAFYEKLGYKTMSRKMVKSLGR